MEESIDMKATGIVRRIDDLGRVVIPKEIRRTMRIREGDPLEIFTDREGEVILKKYSPIGELGMFAKQYAESLSETLSCTVCITDTDVVIAVSGSGKKGLAEKYVTPELEKAIQGREQILAMSDRTTFTKVVPEMEEFTEQVICPIICAGDAIGAVVLLTKNNKQSFGEVEMKVAKSAAAFLGKQMEQ